MCTETLNKSQPKKPKQIVARGFDQIAELYTEWAGDVRKEERARYTSLLLAKLPVGAELLELGCGAGIPTTEQLAERFSVTGVDISEQQIALAQRNVPTARFIVADMCQLGFPPASFDGIAAFYSIIHLPRREHPRLLQALATWLRPGGLLVATMGASSVEAEFDEDWLGVPMYWSHFGIETNRRLVEEAQFNVISANEETADEFGKPVTFLWVVAQKPL